jgi:hypothetical protein
MWRRRAFPAVSERSCFARLLGPFCALVALTVMLAACQHFGPLALEQGRERYNETIHSTSRDQLFANIIRVANGESPLFMDVAEVNANQSFQNTLTGGVGGIGTLLGLQGAGPSVPTSATAGSLSTRVVPNQAGSVGGSVLYSESPTISYQPLSGQALIAQIATPIDIGSIANLINSDWPNLPVMDFAFDRITPYDGQYYVALDAITYLFGKHAVMVAAENSAAMPRQDSTRLVAPGTNITVQTSSQPQQGADALVLYFRPDWPDPTSMQEKSSLAAPEANACQAGQLVPRNYSAVAIADTKDYQAALSVRERNMLHQWIKLLRIYSETQGGDFLTKFSKVRWPAAAAKDHAAVAGADSLGMVDALLVAIDDGIGSITTKDIFYYINNLPRRLELRNKAVPTTPQSARPSKQNDAPVSPPSNSAPVVTTHSALGILLSATGNYIEYVTPDKFNEIYQRANSLGYVPQYYTLSPSSENSLCSSVPSSYCKDDPKASAPDTTAKCVNQLLGQTPPPPTFDTFSYMEDVKDFATLALETRLGSLRRYLLIVVADTASPDAFVSFVHDGKTFYIDGRDEISRKNFALLNQFMTMMAVPTQSSPVTPTVNVGGTR